MKSDFLFSKISFEQKTLLNTQAQEDPCGHTSHYFAHPRSTAVAKRTVTHHSRFATDPSYSIGTTVTMSLENNTAGCGFADSSSEFQSAYRPEITLTYPDGQRSYTGGVYLRCSSVSDGLLNMFAHEGWSTNDYDTFVSEPGFYTYDYPNRPYDLFAESPNTLVSYNYVRTLLLIPLFLLSCNLVTSPQN